MRLLTPSAASLGSGDLCFGVVCSSPWSRGTLRALSLLTVVPVIDVGGCTCASPQAQGSSWLRGTQPCVEVTGGEGHAQHSMKLDLHLLSSCRRVERWWDDLGQDAAHVAASGIQPGVSAVPHRLPPCGHLKR